MHMRSRVEECITAAESVFRGNVLGLGDLSNVIVGILGLIDGSCLGSLFPRLSISRDVPVSHSSLARTARLSSHVYVGTEEFCCLEGFAASLDISPLAICKLGGVCHLYIQSAASSIYDTGHAYLFLHEGNMSRHSS